MHQMLTKSIDVLLNKSTWDVKRFETKKKQQLKPAVSARAKKF